MRLHHLQISCNDVEEAKAKFITLYSFNSFGYLLGNQPEEKIEVLKHGEIYILLRKSKEIIADTIDDIGFCVNSLNCCEKVLYYGGTVIKKAHTENCQTYKGRCKPCSNCLAGVIPCNNSIEKAIVKSSVGNLQHTLIRKTNFCGQFLPGFIPYSTFDENDETIMFDCIDHIALAVPCSETMKHMLWYKNCLELLKFNCSRLEKDNGLVIRAKHGRGLRLFTLIAHPCSEEGVMTEEHEVGNDRVKFVFCESLTQEGTDQIQSFLNNHHSPGVQHVAFKSTSIIEDTQIWYENGVQFLSPPAEYYKIIDNTLNKLEDDQNGLSSSVQDLGILIDVEKTTDGEGENKEGYLYQVFTSPIFASKTFFFELIQRENSFGFGAGNVSALWNALDMSLNGVQ